MDVVFLVIQFSRVIQFEFLVYNPHPEVPLLISLIIDSNDVDVDSSSIIIIDHKATTVFFILPGR